MSFILVTSKKNIYITVLVVTVAILIAELLNSTKPKHPFVGLNITQIVEKYGYPIETHEVITDDGYILALHRIRHGQKKTNGNTIPVLFMHGFSQCSTDYVNFGPNKSLSFLLADKGYDIWLGDARGTTLSRRHKVLNPDRDPEFWNYSLHEIGIYDVPAFMDYIHKVTGETSLHYVGYSQGTSVFFILGSEKPEYAKKVRLMTALAPAIFLKDPKGPALGLLVYFMKSVEVSSYNIIKAFSQAVFNIFRIREFLSQNSFISAYMKQICNEHSLFVELCLHHSSLIHGYNNNEVNRTMLSLIYSNSPAGTSIPQLMHIVQWMASGEFVRHDLGIAGNLEKYGQKEPPAYDLSKITTPIALYYASNDWTINLKNIDKIEESLPNVVKSYHAPLDTFNHNDFIYAKNVVNLLYKVVIEEILKY